MSGSHWAGPVIQFGAAPFGSNLDFNPDRAPSQFDLGMMLLDPRIPYTYLPGNPVTSKAAGWVDGSYIVLDAAPATLAANNLATSQSPGAGAITLTAGAGVTGSTSIVRADTGAIVTGLFALDGATGFTGFGANAQFNSWDPATMLSRAVTITSGSNDAGINFTVNGFDVYGYPMTSTLAGSAGAPGTVTTLKTFKYIQSVTHTGTVAGTVTIGTADIFGLPLRLTDFFYIDLFWNGALITATTGLTTAVLTNPSTAALGDVRGKYAVQSASDGTKRLQATITLSPAALATMNTTTNGYPIGLFGVAQV